MFRYGFPLALLYIASTSFAFSNDNVGDVSKGKNIQVKNSIASNNVQKTRKKDLPNKSGESFLGLAEYDPCTECKRSLSNDKKGVLKESDISASK